MNQAEELWDRCTGSLREQVSETTWQLWLSGIEPVDFANGVKVQPGATRDLGNVKVKPQR